MKQIHEQRKTIHFVRLFDNGYYFISDDNGSEWVLPDGPLSEELAIIGKKEDVAKARDGSWIVIRANHYVSSTGVDKALTQQLKQFRI